MSESATETVLKRKAEAGRGHSGGGAITPEKAVGQALAKAAQDMMKLPLRMASGRAGRMSLTEVIECLPDRALLALLEGPEEGLGLMALAPELLASLIEMQTTGKIVAGAVAARRPTRTDAAMSAPFVDRTLAELELHLASDAAIVWAGGFRYASYLEDARPLGLLMEDGGYRVFRLSLDLGEEPTRKGAFLLALPSEGKGPPPVRSGAGDREGEPVAGSAEAAAEWHRRMEDVLLGARGHIQAVLDRVSLPLTAVLALKPGALIPLSAGVLARLRVESQGRFIAYGKLGQCNGNLAVRLLLTQDGTGRGSSPQPPVPAAEPRPRTQASSGDINSAKAEAAGSAAEDNSKVEAGAATTAPPGAIGR